MMDKIKQLCDLVCCCYSRINASMFIKLQYQTPSSYINR